MDPDLFRVEPKVEGKKIKWSVFVPGKRGSVGKIIVSLIPCCEAHFSARNSRVQRLCADITEAKEEHPDDVMSLDDCERDSYAFIENVFVDRKFRGRDIAGFMLKMCRNYFVNLNRQHYFYHYIELEAEEDMDRYGKLVELYLRNGYQICKPSGAKKDFKMLYNGDQTFRVVPMRNHLIHADSLNNMFGEENVALLSTMKELQSYSFIQNMIDETLSTCRTKMTIKNALEYVEDMFPGTIYKASAVAREVKFRGHPEWLQLLGLISTVGMIQNQLLWTSPLALIQVKNCKSNACLLPGWAHADNCSAWVVKSSDTSSCAMVWSCYEYLYTILKLSAQNQKSHSIPTEGLETLRYLRLNPNAMQQVPDAMDSSFWVDSLRECIATVEKKTDLLSTTSMVSKLDEEHTNLLDIYAPGIISW